MSDATAAQPNLRKPDGWRIRRRIIVLTLIYCAADVGYLSSPWAADTALHQQIAIALIGLAVTVIGSYVFGAVWDDHNARKAGAP